MGCKYACVCAGRCGDCNSYEHEGYLGEAEDVMAQQNGFRTADEWDHWRKREQQPIPCMDEQEGEG